MSSKSVRTIDEINEKIRRGDVVVLTAEEMTSLVREEGVDKAFREVDVVTTGTFGAMCSSGAFFNFGHADPPIKFGGGEVFLNDVPCYAGLAAVDTYLGSTSLSKTRGMEYGGGHVIEDLVARKSVFLEAKAIGTDCYPRTRLRTDITLDDVNQAKLVNPRNCYQRYVVATNTSDKTLLTYLGRLLPHMGNAGASGAGELSPLMNDPTYETIGVGTRILIGGATGYVIGEGTQHNPQAGFGTLMVCGDLKQMSTQYVRGATIPGYGTTLYLGISIPIPILNKNLARSTGISDEEIFTTVVDYGAQTRNRPSLATVSYAELKSGVITIKGKDVRVNFLSSLKKAREIAQELKKRIQKGLFFLSLPTERLSSSTVFRPMKQNIDPVTNFMEPPVFVQENESVHRAAELIINNGIDHLCVIDSSGRLVGFVTTWDISRSVLTHAHIVADIMSRKVITIHKNSTVLEAISKMQTHNLSALPVVDSDQTVVGVVTNHLISRRYSEK